MFAVGGKVVQIFSSSPIRFNFDDTTEAEISDLLYCNRNGCGKLKTSLFVFMFYNTTICCILKQLDGNLPEVDVKDEPDFYEQSHLPA